MKRILAIPLGFLVLAAAADFQYRAMAAEECPPVGGLNFVCGPAAIEDLVQVPGTYWIVGSGMAEMGKAGSLHLIDADRKTWEAFFPGANPRNEPDVKSYPACPGAPDAKTFRPHGIAIQDDGGRASTLLVVNHGREAIEIFKLDSGGAKPSIRWVGCVPLDETTYANSVTFLPEGGFAATKFYDRKAPGGFGSIMAGKPTGGVLEWHAETGIRPIPGTEVAGANGIAASKDGKWIFVASWGSQELVRFSRGSRGLQKDVVKLGFLPDNLRWAPDGSILVAGQNRGDKTAGGFAAFKGWTVVKLNPETLEFTEIAKDNGESPMQNASVAIDVNGTLWIGTFGGGRIAYRPAK